MTDHDLEIAMLKQEVEGLNSKVDDLRADVRELVEAWRAAGVVVSFVKTLAAVVVAVSLIVGAIKYGIVGEGKP